MWLLQMLIPSNCPDMHRYRNEIFFEQNWLSLLFRKNNDGKTPFELACGKDCRRRKEVVNTVGTTLTQYATTSNSHH